MKSRTGKTQGLLLISWVYFYMSTLTRYWWLWSLITINRLQTSFKSVFSLGHVKDCSITSSRYETNVVSLCLVGLSLSMWSDWMTLLKVASATRPWRNNAVLTGVQSSMTLPTAGFIGNSHTTASRFTQLLALAIISTRVYSSEIRSSWLLCWRQCRSLNKDIAIRRD